MGLVDGSQRIYVAVAQGGNGDLNRRPCLGFRNCSGQEKCRLYTQRQRNPLDVVDRHVLLTAFKHAYVSSMHARSLG